MAVQNHKKPEQKTQNRKQSTGRQHSLPGRRKQAQKKQTTETQKKTKTEKQKRKRKNPERIRPQVAKQTYAPISPYKNGRRGDRTATAESTESGRQKQNPGKTKKRNVQKSRMQKTSGLRNAIARKIFCRKGGQTYGSADHRDHTDPADHTSHAGRTGHEPRTCHTEHKARTDHTGLPDHAPALRASRKDSGSFLPRRRNISLTNEKKCCIIDATEQKSRGFRKQSGSHG